MSDPERANGAARLTLLTKLYALRDAIGKRAAMHEMERLARRRELAGDLQELIQVANARLGKKGRILSCSTLYRWLRKDNQTLPWNERIALLAEKHRGKNLIPSDDVIEVFAKYRQPNKPSLAWCVREVANKTGASFNSLEKRCRRAKENLPKALFYPGRNTGPALKVLQPFRRREFLSLSPNDVWIGDGHGAKLKVAHPITGNPFVPEVTAILDVGTRYCVGWSVALSENCIAVSDALRHSVSRHGVPLVYYSDNGGGQKNLMFDAPVTGVLGALGIHHATGYPNNPQARGVIERFWPTVLMPLAQRFETYRGRGADRDTLKKVTREIDKTLRAAKKGELAVFPTKLPTWSQFIAALDVGIEEYNQVHRHSSLPKLDGISHATPAEFRAARIAQTGLELHRPQGSELATLFMPSVVRKAQRGEIKCFNGIYFHRDLMLVDGEQVQVCYDIHEASRVWVKRLSGELIAEAVLDGNRSGYMPQPLIEQQREERAKRRMKLLNGKAAEVQAELTGNAPLDQWAGGFRPPLERPRLVAREATPEERADMERLEAELATPRVKPVELMTDPERFDLWKCLHERKQTGEDLDPSLAAFYAGFERTAHLFLEIEEDLRLPVAGGTNG